MNRITIPPAGQPPPPAADQATVTGLYLTDYERTVKPHQRFLLPNYVVWYWVRKLGPTLAWVVVSLQQACWRAKDDVCTISQAEIAEEIGVDRTTVIRALRHPLCHWFIPTVTTQNRGEHHLPNEYHVYTTPPLIPLHLSGLDHYLTETCLSNSVHEVTSPLTHLLSLSTKDAVVLGEHYVHNNDPLFNTTTPVVNLATRHLPQSLNTEQRSTLAQQTDDLQIHLTNLGHTEIRQYFRRRWVKLLGPALAWIVMALRSHCFYTHTTQELRDTCTWSKNYLAAIIGQSSDSLRKGLLTRNYYSSHFFKILNTQTRTIQFQVSMVREPLIKESAMKSWEKQAQLNRQSRKSATSEPGNLQLRNRQSRKSATSEPGNLQHQSHQSRKSATSELPNPEKCNTFKVLNLKVPQDSIPEQILSPNGHPDDSEKIPSAVVWQQTLVTLQHQTTKATFNRWLRNTRLLHSQNGCYTVAVPDLYAKDWLETRLAGVVERALSGVAGRSLSVRFEAVAGETDAL